MEHVVELAPLTTLRLGGPAEHFVRVESRAALLQALAWAREEAQPVRILGGGSNLLVADEGVPGLVVQLATRGIEQDGNVLTVQAGEPWEAVVERALTAGLAGIECLSGIPGSTGATPIQNVGAYGQDVSQVIEAVEVLERVSGNIHWIPADECRFGYRDSRFKNAIDEYIVLAVRFALRADGVARVDYPELAAAVGQSPSLRDVQAAVRRLRASKGMLIDDGFEPSVGSFFMNPIVTQAEYAAVEREALARGLVERSEDIPHFAAGEDVKLAAAWLIEHTGIYKGMRRGPVGVSARHPLALVHHGRGTMRELLALADEIRTRVENVFGIRLAREPVYWGPQNA